MEYGPSDSSGTDDDLPPSHQNRGARAGGVIGNGRTAIAPQYPRVQNDMETRIHRLEQEAYCSVLRAFKAQSDAITWEKESLITEMRKELRVSDEEHRELLNRVNSDDIIRRIREWRQAGGGQSGLITNNQPVHNVPSPTVSASRKRPKTSQSIPSLVAPSSALHTQTFAASMQPSPSTAKRGIPVGPKGKKTKSGSSLPGASTLKSTQLPAEGAHDPLVGRKVWTRWPDDNSFYEAVITNHNPAEGLHFLVYDINTDHETYEWVNLKEIPPQDIRWEGKDPGITRQGGRGGAGRGPKKSTGGAGAIPGAGRGRGTLKNHSKKAFPASRNGIGKKNSNEIEILHTDTLIKEVERVFGATHPDPQEIEKAKKLLKEHEQSLIDAIARLADASDGESEEGDHQLSHGQSVDRDRHWRNRYEDDVMGGSRDGAGGDHAAKDGIASGYRQGREDDDI